MEPVLDEVLHSERIEVLTGAEVRARARRATAGSRSRSRSRRATSTPPPASAAASARRPARSSVPIPSLAGSDPQGDRRSRTPAACRTSRSSSAAPACHVADGSCDACVAACAFGAVRLDDAPRTREVTVGAIVIATGLEPGDRGRTRGVVSSYQLERMLHPDGPTAGRGCAARAGATPRAVLLAAAAAADDEPAGDRGVLKLAHLVRARAPAARVVGRGRARPRAAARAARAALAAEGVELLAGALVPDGVRRGAGTGSRCGSPHETRRDGARGGPRRRARAVAPGRRRGRARRAPARRHATRAASCARRREPVRADARRASPGVCVAGRGGGPAADPRGDPGRRRRGGAGPRGARARREEGARAARGRGGRSSSAAAAGSASRPVRSARSSLEAAGGALAWSRSTAAAAATCAAACPTGAASAPHFTRAQLAAEISALLRPRDGTGRGDEP